MKKRAGRPPLFKKDCVVSSRFDFVEYSRIVAIAAFETQHTGRKVTAQELIRNAVRFVFEDNERMRESFRRTRAWSSFRH